MEYSNGQQRRMRPEDDHAYSQPTQIPRPAWNTSARPPVQISKPPRSHQYQRSGPGNPYRQPYPQSHDRSANVSESSLPSPQRFAYPRRQASDHQAPPVSYQPNGRHLSHISALSVAHSELDSRPISEVDSTYTVGPAFPSKAVSEIDEEEEHNGTESAPHSRKGSQGRRTKTTTTPTRSRKNSVPIRDSETLPSSDQAATMQALTAAIRQGLSPTTSRSQTPKPFSEIPGFRMPFQDEPSSPSSVYTDLTATNKRLSAPLSSYQGYDPRESKPSTIAEQEVDYEKSGYAHDLPTPMSTHPIMSGVQPGMSSKVGPAKRPLKLDIGAVREAEARGSMTSLSDLIRRATRLASNLDRGRTASRLGHLDMFGSSDKLGNNNYRSSTYSDVLNAFPPPADGTTTPGGRPITMWPNGEKQHMASKSSLGRFVDKNDDDEKPKRRCCGMSPLVFVIVLVTLFLLVAAAVLVPVFLIVLPRQNQNSVDLAACSSSHSCQNGGLSASTGSACSCVCVDGFTGDDCSTERDPECLTASISDGSTTYDNATIGSSVLPILKQTQSSFNIDLNTTKILAQFAHNNLSCASENSLVDFGVDHASTQVKRFVIVPGMMHSEPHLPVLNLPPSESKEHPRFVIVDSMADELEGLNLPPSHTVAPRQDATQSANGIVFATSSDAAATPTATSTSSGTSTVNTTSTSSSKMNVTDTELDFAATVVLYVLQSSSEISNAVTANQAILTHFQMSTSNKTVELASGKEVIQADFGKFQIKFANGTVIGKQ